MEDSWHAEAAFFNQLLQVSKVENNWFTILVLQTGMQAGAQRLKNAAIKIEAAHGV